MFFGGWTIILVIPALIFTIYAQFKVKSTFRKYLDVTAASGMTGAQVARDLLNRSHLDDVPVERVRAFEAAFHQFMASQKADLLATIATGEAMTPEVEAALEAAIREFKAIGGY